MGSTIGNYPAALVLYFVCMGLWYPILAQDSVDIFTNTTISKGDVGHPANVTCEVYPENATISWLFNGKRLESTSHERINITSNKGLLPGRDGDGSQNKTIVSTISISNLTYDDAGNYTCLAKVGENTANQTELLDLSFNGRLLKTTGSIKVNYTDHSNVSMMCDFEVYNPVVVKWMKRGKTPEENTLLKEDSELTTIGVKQVQSIYHLHILHKDDQGIYICEVEDTVSGNNITGTIEVLIYAPPTLIIDRVIPINTTELYINWTVQTYNSKIDNYALSYALAGNTTFVYKPQKINIENTSFVINDLEKNTTYRIKLEVKTAYGRSSNIYPENVTTLAEEPEFKPNISINGFSATSVTIGWQAPPAHIAKLIHYYELTATKKGESNTTFKTCYSRDDSDLPYMFANLKPHSTYVFQVQACSDYAKKCGPLSDKMEAATLDGVPSMPINVTAVCNIDYLNLTWKPPLNPNAEIKGYTVEITGTSDFVDRYGYNKRATFGPLSKFLTNESTSIRVNELTPNTLYTVHVSAMTRTRRRGEEGTATCQTYPTIPDAPPKPRWRKILENDTYMFKMYLPRISERNGPICCYRVYMVRLVPGMDWKKLPSSPRSINVVDYEEAHKMSQTVTAYVTDIFSNAKFPSDSEIVLGDEKSIFDPKSDQKLSSEKCRRCLKKHKWVPPPPPPPPVTTSTTVTTPDDLVDSLVEYDMTEDPTDPAPKRDRRSASDGDYSNDPTMSNKLTDVKDNINVKDGPLESNANYTLFVELISEVESEESIFSDYTSALQAAPSAPVALPASALEIALQITCGVAGIILVLMIAFCILQTRRTRKMQPHAQFELHNPITAAIRYWDSIRGHRPMAAQLPPEIPPIAKEDLAMEYLKRQVDSDYGFQKEFELLQMLPECFPDRTCHASEARENQPKNRYPDIKAYDQTRVKLTQIDSINGSDYINANYVRGYQERKQYICAQGPTDTTCNDFWRMIWELGLEIIVMLTNLEEYSKIKCSKYWPDEGTSRTFGNITVHHVCEKRYSDYMVRELKIYKTATNADGQPIVENNGIAKRNGDIKDGHSETSAPTSPREVKECGESRTVRQFHFLRWKDFGAPEHPHCVLRFIKRVNESWSNVVGRPLVVHCSAGVGRTGTLVAVDLLLDQLRETGQVSVFNTVADLRRQRNFLVQSLRQYIFVYRALVEYAHFGDTEINASELKPAVDKLRNTPEGADKCLMEYEFEKMLVNPVMDPPKPMAAAAAEELRAKNRNADYLPYDRNRVMLTPIPGRDYSAYINASFIEAYDNVETFIITQDPLPNTILDFWRMVSEHHVTTIVMLSELGEGKCPRYWDDGTAEYEHMSVHYEESESCPYYTRRQFRVVNEKNGDSSYVRQLQYQGWPTARGHVPEVTRGLAELADAAGAALRADQQGTMLVHCQFGTERSPLFVALCGLIKQLRCERKVDVGGAARTLRAQRARTIDTFLQYEFLYRAILNYAELHNLLEDS
ncbi:unnamed protein product [Arctia plantaginis]|uniref:protein-tyrosine-phosphatase n=1 Tax=Arctia plantaginis TaxID=874455 RepID=A0A8S0ZHI4_ARCPL|nr:unnamed protein product [Arctia plantaginis]